MEEEFLFFTSLLFPGTKKALRMDLESPLTHCECFGIFIALERAARPSGCFEPGTATRQSLVPGFFYSFIGKLLYIAGLHFACSNPFCIFIIPSSPLFGFLQLLISWKSVLIRVPKMEIPIL